MSTRSRPTVGTANARCRVGYTSRGVPTARVTTSRRRGRLVPADRRPVTAARHHRKGWLGMKVRSSLRSLKQKANSIVVRRRGKLFVLNKADPRQKARQG
ncbi:hypothetical protein GCM10027259_29090 [Micromonospora palomenae]